MGWARDLPVLVGLLSLRQSQKVWLQVPTYSGLLSSVGTNYFLLGVYPACRRVAVEGPAHDILFLLSGTVTISSGRGLP